MNSFRTYRILLLSLVVLFSASSSAKHIVGGEISAEFVLWDSINNEWEYKITVSVYRDCGPTGGTRWDRPMYLAVFQASNNSFVQNLTIPLVDTTKLPVVVNNPCLKAPPNICTDLGFYQSNIRLPVNSGGYVLTYQRCCRNAGIVNVMSAGVTGSTYRIRIPGTSEIGNSPNNSPTFTNYPPLVLCLNDSVYFDHSATEPDGDSLVYSLCSPFSGGSYNFPQPPLGNPVTPPPYMPIIWSPGFNANNQITGSPGFTIDPRTGILRGTATAIGKYVVGVCVSEYRNGVFLCENKRDFQFTVTQCDPNSIAAASSQERFCEGLTVNFKNDSKNAVNFFWDFGEINLTNDTSYQAEPSWTYSDTGKYTITLIANPGLSCADTIYTVYEVYELLEPFFDRPAGQCFEEHSFDLQAGGLFQQYADFEWDFGDEAVVTKSFIKDPTDVRFTEPGVYPVTLTIRENGCTEEYIDSLYVYPKPVPRFSVESRDGCVPYAVTFENTSESWSPMKFLWDFGDGNVSAEETPTHYYTEPGVFDVRLFVSTNEVCTAEVALPKVGYIRVNAIPEAKLIVENPVTFISDPIVRFRDRSEGATICKLDLGDGLQSPNCDYAHEYRQAGKYTVTQVVLSQYGCTDTSYWDVIIRPQVSLFVPNTFTPNDDQVNETFRAYGEPVKGYEFKIFTRWGNHIFTSYDLDRGWDGMINGKPAPSDKYVYYIRLVDALDEEQEMRGSFTLLR